MFKISGKPRRELKKELSKLKYTVKMFWHHQDLGETLGGALENPHEVLEKLRSDIRELEKRLQETV